MEKTKNGKAAQGAESPEEKKPLDIGQVREFVKRDLAACINMLDAIYRDQATTEMLSDILYGRYLNAKHKDELEKQTKLPV